MTSTFELQLTIGSIPSKSVSISSVLTVPFEKFDEGTICFSSFNSQVPITCDSYHVSGTLTRIPSSSPHKFSGTLIPGAKNSCKLTGRVLIQPNLFNSRLFDLSIMHNGSMISSIVFDSLSHESAETRSISNKCTSPITDTTRCHKSLTPNSPRILSTLNTSYLETPSPLRRSKPIDSPLGSTGPNASLLSSCRKPRTLAVVKEDGSTETVEHNPLKSSLEVLKATKSLLRSVSVNDRFSDNSSSFKSPEELILELASEVQTLSNQIVSSYSDALFQINNLEARKPTIESSSSFNGHVL
ncbi:hypothetical protein GEMRC1_007316 [Eukaryota sp. GEM-RC1]